MQTTQNHTKESLFTLALGLQKPWDVEKIEFTENNNKELHITLKSEKGFHFGCEHCGLSHTAHDKVKRTWKHLRFFEHPTYIHAEVPRVYCKEHNRVGNISLPFARANSGFTLLFEVLVLELSQHMPMMSVARITGESGPTMYRIIDHYINKSRIQEDWSTVNRVGVDETSTKTGHNYMSTLVDTEQAKVLSITPGKDYTVINRLLLDFEAHKGKRENITQLCCDLSLAFRKGIGIELPNVIITSDRFHVMCIVSRAQDLVRKREYKKQKNIKNLRFALLSNPENMTETQQQLVNVLKDENLETIRAYQMRLSLRDIYETATTTTAEKEIKAWVQYVIESKIPEMVSVANTVLNFLPEILQYFITKMTNGVVEGMNSTIQLIKRRGRGFGNINHFMTMIYLKCGKLQFNLPSVMTYPR